MDKATYNKAVADMRERRERHEAHYRAEGIEGAVNDLAALPDDQLMTQAVLRIVPAASDPTTHRTLTALAALMLRQRRGLPVEMADWIADALEGKNKPKGKARTKELRNLIIGQAIDRACKDFGLNPYRSAASEHRLSGCDAAAQVWPHLTYINASKLWREYKAEKAKRSRRIFHPGINRTH